MKRYQVYLNPNSVLVLDELEEYTNISRSKLIREAVDYLAQNLAKVFAAKKAAPKNKLILDKLVGSIKIKGQKQTNYALKADRAYLFD